MSFKCSVFGHRFGDPEVEREREEEGSEVVITITETETCTRCGERRVVSENKEVTTLETPSGAAGASGANQGGGDGEEGGDGTGEAIAAQGPDGAGAPGPEAGVGAGNGTTEANAETGAGAGTEEWSDDEDDAVILEEDDGGDTERAPGEWPGTDEEKDEETWRPDTDVPETEDRGRTEPDPADGAVTVPEGEFYCPECEFTTAVEESSLRAGDFCPECHRGALASRTSE